MVTMANAGNAVDERDVYTPPCVVRISDLNRGEGQGSVCHTGSGDTFECYNNGNGADASCTGTGSGVYGVIVACGPGSAQI